MKEGETALKIVLLGNSGVGKTSLVTMWALETKSLAIKPTIGANHQKKRVTINHEDVDLYLWDTAGQEQFQALTPLYTRSSTCAILTASIVDTESFSGLDKWIDLIKESCDVIPPMMLIVNKIDLDANAVLQRDDIDKKYKPLFNGIFYCSAETGEGVEQAFMHAGQLAYDFVRQSISSDSTVKIAEGEKEKNGCSC